MNVRQVMCWCVVAALPQLALAGTSSEDLGALQAVHDFCAKIDPSHAKNYEKQADGLFYGLTAKQVSAMRSSTRYKTGYQSLTSVLPELPNDAATIQACNAILGPKSNHPK